MLNGTLFRFVGANMYNAAGDPNIYECGPWMRDPDKELDDWFGRFKRDSGGRTVRFWAFQKYTNGGTDWRSFDRVVRLAKKHGLKVIPVLENQWEACTEGGRKYDDWYEGGYLSPYGNYPICYKEWVRRVVERYKCESAIAAWVLMNEAESKTRTGEARSEPLYAFARDMSAYVKSLDKNHLVTLGVSGTAQPGVSGPNYERLHSLSTIDFLEFHDYGENDEAMPGADKSPLNTTVFTQDYNWNWYDVGYQNNRARTWETFSAIVPSGAKPFRKIGVNLYGDFAGNAYVDQVRIGSRVYDFENGVERHWQSSGNVTLSNASSNAYTGGRALKLTISRPGGWQVWVPARPEDAPGTRITVRMYVDTTAAPPDTLAGAMHASKKLNKPILVGESGMTTCRAISGSQQETPESRARKFSAKMGAFFEGGGGGYLVWAWHPSDDCDHNFTTSDPLNAVLAQYTAST